MRTSSSRIEEDRLLLDDSDSPDEGRLDLLNFSLSAPVNAPEGLFQYRRRLHGSGDNLQDEGVQTKHHHHHPLEKSHVRLVPDIQKGPKGYANTIRPKDSILSENLILLYERTEPKQFVSTEPIQKDDFLYPSKRRTDHHIGTNEQAQDGAVKFCSKQKSGHSRAQTLKSFADCENTRQVIREKDNNLCIQIHNTVHNFSEGRENWNRNKMANEQPEFTKTSAMDTIISQAGFSTLGSLIGNTPIRSGNKEASEYENKQTSEILDPELNLGRLGYNGTDPITWEKVALPEKKNLYLELYSRITNYTNADCKVYIDNEEFNCHLIVLQCYSELFDAYIAVKKVELPVDKCSACAFAFIYEWMITGEPSYKELNRENVLEIFNSAKYLKIKDLVEQCWSFIDNTEVFCEDTAYLLYMDAKNKKLPEVRELMIPRIQGFFLMLVSSQDWLELELEDVKTLLSSNYICVNCEMEIFMSAVRWLKHDWANRDQYKYELFDCVRFGNIAPWQLVDIKRNPENPDFMELAKDPKICKMIDDGLAFVIIKYWYGQENDDFQHWNSVLGLHEPPSRNWSGSDKTYFTYREFLIYLDQYRRNQLIEKNKPRMMSDKKKVLDAAKLTDKVPEKNPNLPTMDEFLSKKKEQLVYQTDEIKSQRGLNWKESEVTVDQPSNDREIASGQDNQEVSQEGNKKAVAETKKKEAKPNEFWKKQNKKISKLFTLSKNRPPNDAGNQQQTNEPITVQPTSVPPITLYQHHREALLVFGGIDPHVEYAPVRNSGKCVYSYIPEDNVWEQVAILPEPRHHHSAQYVKGKIYIAGGADPKGKVVVSSVWCFDPSMKKWYYEGSMLTPRKNFALIFYGGQLHAIGGQSNNSIILKSTEKYNFKERTWSEGRPMKFARTGFGHAVYQDEIWVAGGLSGRKKNTLLKTVEAYNLKTDQWSEIAFLDFPRCFTYMFVMADRLYMIGGAGKTLDKNSMITSVGNVEVWDDSLYDWKKITDLAIPRHGHCVAPMGSQMFIIGGVTTSYMRALSNIECYCIQRDTWVRGIACLPKALSGHAAITLPPDETPKA